MVFRLWAKNVPIRPDGSVRSKFWAVRHYLWGHTLAKTTFEDKSLTLSFKGGLLATCRGDTSLKIETTASPKSTVYRLKLNGELVAVNEVYHTGTAIDQYRCDVVLKAGQNLIVLKVCQNEQTESWAQDWKFQLRVTDALGKPIRLARPSTEPQE